MEEQQTQQEMIFWILKSTDLCSGSINWFSQIGDKVTHASKYWWLVLVVTGPLVLSSPQSTQPSKLPRDWRTSCFHLLINVVEISSLFFRRAWHPPTVAKLVPTSTKRTDSYQSNLGNTIILITSMHGMLVISVVLRVKWPTVVSTFASLLF